MEPTDPESPGVVAPRRAGPGTRIGRYEIVELLGAGGMGEVYRAVDGALGRPVAIKLLRSDRLGLSSEMLLREAQAMARLTHPNVVVVYEIGALRGEIFVAMELVDGQTARDWLDGKKRGRREIFDVYLAAGRGLAAAHAVGLVHGDFKPENVLIGANGRARVADFGLAAEAGAGEGSASGTPAYMSPEQHDGQPRDARSDQFAFCVALWEALHGVRPFQGDVRTSIAAGKIAPPPAGAEVPAWIRAILARGLSVRREDRFPSMDALLDALGRDPAARRRRIALGIGLALAAAGLVVVSRHSVARERPCAGAAARLAGVWDPAVRAEVRDAFAASGRPHAPQTFERVAAKLDAYTAAWTAMHTEACEATSVRHEQSEALLDLRMQCLDRRRGELRAVTTLLAQGPDPAIVDRAGVAVGRLDDVAACADAQGTQPLPADPAVRSRVAALRARVQEIHALGLLGKAKPALEAMAAVMPEVERTGYDPLELEALGELRNAHGTLRHTAEQKEALRRIILVAARVPDDRRAARAWTELIVAVGAIEHRFDEALALRTGAEAAVVRAGNGELLRALLLSALGRVYTNEGDLRAAEPLLREADGLFVAAREAGVNRAVNLNELGGVLLFSGRYEEAGAVFERIRAIYDRELGPEHPFAVGNSLNLALTLLKRGRLAEAAALDERAAESFAASEGPDGFDVGGALNDLGEVMLANEDWAGALPRFERAVAVKEKARGPDDASVASSLLGQGWALARLGRLDEAAAPLARARAIWEKKLGAAHADTGHAIAAQALLASLRGDCRGAILGAEQAVAIIAKAYDPGHPDLVDALLVVGGCQLALGRPQAARAPLERAMFISVTRGGAPAGVPEAELALAQARWEAGDRDARRLGEQAHAGFASLGLAARAADAERWLAAHGQN